MNQSFDETYQFVAHSEAAKKHDLSTYEDFSALVKEVTAEYEAKSKARGYKFEGAEERDGFIIVKLRRSDGDFEIHCDNRPREGGRYVRDEMVIDHRIEENAPGFVEQQIVLMVERCKQEYKSA
jgi:hypothetical protein